MIGGLIQDRGILDKDASKGDQYLLKSLQGMQHLTQKSGINFIHDYAIRIFLKNGYSVSLTTNRRWNDFLCDIENQRCIKEHYSYYLKYIAQNGLKYQIRRPEDANTDFLKHLEKAKMCNALTIFKRSEDMVIACFFSALPSNAEAINFFYNKLEVFNKIADLIEQEFLQNKNYLKATDNKYRIKILEPLEVRLVFDDMISRTLGGSIINLNGKEVLFTDQEVDILQNIISNYTLKSLATLLGITVSGVNYRMDCIKRKINANSKQEVVQFANDRKKEFIKNIEEQ
jgi:DNA-binding CsgD family transcriptional regulator